MADSFSAVSLPPIFGHTFKSTTSTTSNKTLLSEETTFKPLAAERWNVQKKKHEQSVVMKNYYDSYVSRCRNLENMTNKKVSEMYNQIYYELKWSNPPVSNPHGKLILNYCKHVIKYGSTVPFTYELELATWNTKVKGNILEKVVGKIKKMYMKLFQYVQRRDEKINILQNELYSVGERMKIQNDTTLRFMMETNFNHKDKFFTIWNLASANKIRELTVLLKAPSKSDEYREHGINTKDPDFGLTPLHYACRAGHSDMVRYLLSLGANPSIAAPDGRTALHFAAAYGNREILLMLLALGLDASCRDNYQCTPLDLARQNFNKNTIPTLESWGTLTKIQVHDSKSFANEEEDFDEDFEWIFDENQESIMIPDEFKPVDPTIFQQMSPHLKLTTKRLNGFNPYITNPPKITVDTLNSSTFSMNSTWAAPPQPMNVLLPQESHSGEHSSTVGDSIQSSISAEFPQLNKLEKLLSEIRLCSKHYNMCVKELFFDEAVKSLRRRWFVAKYLYKEIVAEASRKTEDAHMVAIEEERPVISAASTINQKGDCIESATVGSNCSDLTLCYDKREDAVNPVLLIDDAVDSFGKGVTCDNNNIPNEGVQMEHFKHDGSAICYNPEIYDDDDDDESPSMSLEKIAHKFLSTTSNVTYLPPTPRAEIVDGSFSRDRENGSYDDTGCCKEHELGGDLMHGSSCSNSSDLFPHLPQELISTEPSSIEKCNTLGSLLQHISQRNGQSPENGQTDEQVIHKITLTKSGVLVANDDLDVSDSSIAAQLNQDDLVSPHPHFYDIADISKTPSCFQNDQGFEAKQFSNMSFVDTKLAKLGNPDYILKVVETFMDKSRVIRLEEYSWRYENKEILDHYTQFSSTASWADNSMSISSASLSVNRGNFGQTISGNYVIRLGYELVEVFLVLRRLDDAYIAIEECLALHHGVLISTRISVISQKCDLLIYFFDHWDEVSEFVQNLIEFYPEKIRTSGRKSSTINDSLISFESHELDDSHKPCSNEFKQDNEFGEQDKKDNHFQRTHESMSAFDPRNGEMHIHEEFGVKTVSAAIDDLKRWVLSECIEWAQEIIDLSYILSRNHLIEPFSVARAMSYISKAKERQCQFIEAWQYADQASLIAIRCKDATVETVGLMIDVSFSANLVGFCFYFLLHIISRRKDCL